MPRLKKRRPKLKGRARELASKFIVEEVSTRKYPRKQAIAIGISRAKAKIKRERTHQTMKSLMKRLTDKYKL